MMAVAEDVLTMILTIVGVIVLLYVFVSMYSATMERRRKLTQPIRRRFSSSLEKYLGEVRLQRFGIGRLTAEADIAVGTHHIQTWTLSSIAVV